MNLYFTASQTLARLSDPSTSHGSIKSVLASLPADKDKRRISALVLQSLKYKPVLTQIISTSGLLTHERKRLAAHPTLALVLVHDLLFTHGGIQAGDGPYKQAIVRHKTRLKAELGKIMMRQGVTSHLELVKGAAPPRYIRVNTLLWTVREAVEYLTGNGFVLDASPMSSPISLALDEHVPCLLAFHPSVSFTEKSTSSPNGALSRAYEQGKLIIQDKSSCFPAFVLFPPSAQDTKVIDATAAPGNKTTFLSALMEGKGKVFAFERSPTRLKTLNQMLSKAQCRNVEPVNQDFLTVDPEDPTYAKVSHILVDPSCSGSGIVNRLDHLLENESEESSQKDEKAAQQTERLRKLSSFQAMMVKHAMKFPSVQKIVYSTCSIHPEENEHVVREVLESQLQPPAFRLASRKDVIPAWERRGMAEQIGDFADEAESLIRCSPSEDGTNGFFVACFVRADPDDEPGNDDEEEEWFGIGNEGKRKHELETELELEGEQKRKKRKKKKKRKVLVNVS